MSLRGRIANVAIQKIKSWKIVWVASPLARKNIIITILLCLIASVSHAGAWTQAVKQGLFIPNISYYSTSKFFDNYGNKQSQNKYSKYELNPYVEYGLHDKLTIGANIFLQRASQYDSDKAKNQPNWGIGDSEFFLRKEIWQKNDFVFSIEPILKLPSLDKKSDQPQIGSKNYDTELTFSGGYSFKAWQFDHFINLDVGYRHRFGTPHDQLKFAATAGILITKNTKIMTQFFSTSRLKNAQQSTFTQSSGDDYDLAKLQISTIYEVDDKLSLQVGAFSHIAGRNIGGGNGAILSANQRF